MPLGKKTHMPARADALPGRATPVPLSGKHFVNGSQIKQPAVGGLQEAVFGLGCFWGAERLFWQIPGVVTTSVGYAGGFTRNATYEDVNAMPRVLCRCKLKFVIDGQRFLIVAN